MGIFADLLDKEPPEQKKGIFSDILDKDPPHVVAQQKVQAGQTLSRNDMLNMGIEEPPNRKQRKIISDVLRRSPPISVPGPGGAGFGAATTPEFFTKTKKAFQRGGGAVNVDFMWRKAQTGEITEAEAQAAEDAFNKLQRSDPVEGRNFAESLWLKTVGITAPMVKGTLKGFKYGTVAGGAAAVGGQLGPQAIAPEEIVTVPGAFAAGHTIGSLKYWAEQGSGTIYREARKAGVSRNGADIAASIGGPLYGAIEFSQVGKIIPGLGKISRGARKLLVALAKNWASEVTEEGAQKVVTEGVTAVTRLVEGGLEVGDVPDEAKRIIKESLVEMKESAGPMALLQVPGGAVSAGRALVERGAPAAPTQPTEVPSEAPTQASVDEVAPEAVSPPKAPVAPEGKPTVQQRAKELGVPTKGLTKAAVEKRVAAAEAKKRKVPKPSKLQVETGEQFGLSETDVANRLHKAQLRYEELRSKPVEDLKPSQKKELDFLKRKRTDIQALLGRDIKPLTRQQIEARAKQFGIPTIGRTKKAIMKDIIVRAEETRKPREVTGWPEWRKGEPVNVTPDKLLKFSLQHEARGARKGFRAGQIELTATHKELLEHAEKALPPGEYKLVVKAARRAVKARTPGEIKKVIKAVNQMVENAEKAEAVKQVRDTIKAAKKAKLRPEFQKAVDDITEEFTLSTPREQTVKRMESLLEAAERDEHKIGDIPQKLIDRAKEILANTEKKTLKDFNADELHAISDAISSLIHQDTLKKELLFSRTHRKIKETMAKATKAVKDRWGKKHEVEAGKYDDKAERGKLHKAWNAIKNISTWAQLNIRKKAQLLGGRNSIAEDLLANNLAEGDNFTIEVNNDSADYMAEQLEKAGVDKETQQKWSQALGKKKAKPVSVALPEARSEDGKRVRTLEMTVAERIAFLRFITDPQNRAAMLDDQNKGITFARDKAQKAIKLTAKDMKAIIDSASQAEKDIAQAMVDYVNDKAPGRIQIGQKVQDVWLKLMGFPLRVHDNYVSRRRSREHRKYDPTHTTKNFAERRLERMGIFKKRAEVTAPFVIGDAFAEFHADVNRMAAFAGKALPVHDAKQLLNDLAFRRSVKEAFKHGDALLKDLEQTVEFYQGLDQPPQGPVEAFFRPILRRAHVGALAAKAHIVLYQTVSLLNTVAVGMQSKHIFNPAHFRLSEIRRIRQVLNENSPSLNARERGGSIQMFTPSAAGDSLRQMYGMEKKRLRAIHRADASVMELIGLAAEAEGKAKGLSGKELNEYIARRTEFIVAESQPSWDATTLSSLAREGRSGVFKHMLVMFSSQRNKHINMEVGATLDYMFSDKTAADKATLAKAVAIPTIANAILIYGISEAYWYGLKSMARLLGFRPKDKEKKWQDHLVGILERMLGNVLIVGDLVSDVMVNILKGIGGVPSMFKRHRGNIVSDARGQTMEGLIALSDFTRSSITGKTAAGKKMTKDQREKNIFKLYQGLESVGRAAGPLTGTPIQGYLQIASPFLPHRQQTKTEVIAERRAKVKIIQKTEALSDEAKNKRIKEINAEYEKILEAFR
jgi:hypothetical protein